MDLNQLRTLIHVAELGSLSKAADRLRIVQPALSRQIRMLEAELGVRLFDRHGRGMVLTERGAAALAHARRVIAEVDDLRLVGADSAATLSGHVAIGLPPTVADLVSVFYVSAMQQAYPNVTLRLISAYTGYLLDWLHRGDLDLAILYDPRQNRSLRSEPLLTERLYIVGAPGSGLDIRQPYPFQRLGEGVRLLLPSLRHGLRAIFESAASESGTVCNVILEADSYATLKDLVHAGMGYTILPYAPIRADIAAGRLTVAPLVKPEPTRQLSLAWPADRPVTRLARVAGETLSHIIRKHIPGIEATKDDREDDASLRSPG